MGVVACGGSQASSTPDGAARDGDSCGALAKPAIDQALAVAEQHTACATDADCVSVGMAAACFDVCSRAVNAADVDAIKAALAGADCSEFVAAGCAVTAPPCAPPAAPICNQGRCE